MWKENPLEDLESGKVEFGQAGEFLLELQKEFGERDKESVKVAELKMVEQKRRIIEEFVQEFRRAARERRYERRVLVDVRCGSYQR